METYLKQIVSENRSDIPLYKQLAGEIRLLIENGKVSKGDLLPSERVLTEITGASRVTIRKAISELIDEGLLFRRQGAGTFIAQGIEQSGEELSSFSSDTLSRGAQPSSLWLIKTIAKANSEEANLLKIAVGEEVLKLGRVRVSDNEPLAIEHATIPLRLIGAPELIEDSLYDALNKRGNRPVDGTQKIRASLASPIEAGLLSISEGAEVLRIERHSFLKDGTPVEHTRSVYRGDKYVFVTDLHL